MKKIDDIMVSIDFSKNSNIILDAALYLAREFKANLTVVHVAETLTAYAGLSIPHISLPKLEEELQESARKKMEDIIQNINEEFTITSNILSGDAAEQIVSFAKENDFDLLVLGTHGFKGIGKILLGSVAEKVVRTAPCPVLTIKPTK